MGVGRNWASTKKRPEKGVFSSGLRGTRTCVVSTQCGRKGPGARRPRSRPVSRLMDRSVFLHCRGRGGEGGVVSSLFCFLFKKPIIDVTGDASQRRNELKAPVSVLTCGVLLTVCADSGKRDSGPEPASVYIVMWDHAEAAVMLRSYHRHVL